MRSLVILVISLTVVRGHAQPGGGNVFDFLRVAQSARLAGLGGVNVSLADRDASLFASNPALTGDTLSGTASVNHQFYVADIGHSFLSYAHTFGRIGTLHIGVQHLRYGKISGYDDTGSPTLPFSSGETAVIVARNHQAGNFRLGAGLKGVFSNIAGYRASALLIDIGGVFIHPRKSVTVGLTVKNFGFVLTNDQAPADRRTPFDVQLGATVKPEHMPLRFSLTAFNLPKAYDTDYYVAASERQGMLGRVLSHINFGTEILLHKHVNILAGYNFPLHQTLQLERGGAGAGVALGFSAAIGNFELVFSRNSYVAGSAGYSFTLSANVNALSMRR